VLGVSLWGVVHGTKAFLPHLVASGDGHVVNISSLNGYLAQAGMSHCCTSKFAVRGFTETLRVELAAADLPVLATVVHPGGVRTHIADRAFAAAERRGEPVTDEDRRRRDLYNEKLLRMDRLRRRGRCSTGWRPAGRGCSSATTPRPSTCSCACCRLRTRG
jgi:NAD(P)-dependent dehydrogenase (short-subunit alcohol dehydrogenase family)